MQERSDRYLEVIIGIVAIPAAVIAVIIGVNLILSFRSIDLNLILGILFIGFAMLLVNSSRRLLTDQPREDGGLLSPLIIIAGSFILAIGSLIVLIFTSKNSILYVVLTFLSAAATIAGGLKLARVRRKNENGT